MIVVPACFSAAGAADCTHLALPDVHTPIRPDYRYTYRIISEQIAKYLGKAHRVGRGERIAQLVAECVAKNSSSRRLVSAISAAHEGGIGPDQPDYGSSGMLNRGTYSATSDTPPSQRRIRTSMSLGMNLRSPCFEPLIQNTGLPGWPSGW